MSASVQIPSRAVSGLPAAASIRRPHTSGSALAPRSANWAAQLTGTDIGPSFRSGVCPCNGLQGAQHPELFWSDEPIVVTSCVSGGGGVLLEGEKLGPFSIPLLYTGSFSAPDRAGDEPFSGVCVVGQDGEQVELTTQAEFDACNTELAAIANNDGIQCNYSVSGLA